jgi:hypothetical protein
MGCRHIAWSIVALLVLSLPACKKKDAAPAGGASSTEVALPESAKLPDDVLGFLVAGNPSALAAELEKFAALAGPVPPGALTGLMTASLLGNGFKDATAVDFGAPAGLLLLNPKVSPKAVIFSLTAKSEEAFLKSMDPAWKEKSNKDGVRELTQGSLDTYQVFKGKGEGEAEANPKSEVSLFVKFSGKTAFLGFEGASLQTFVPVLEEQLKKFSSGAGLSGLFSVNHLRRVYQEEFKMAKAAVGKEMSQELAAKGQLNDWMIWMITWMTEKTFSFVDQTMDFSFSLAVDEKSALFKTGLSPEPDSFFSKFLAAQKHDQPLQLLQTLPGEGFLVFGANIQWSLIKEDLKSFTKEVVEKLAGQSISSEWINVVTEFMSILGDEVAFSEDIHGGLQVVEVFSVTDESAAIKLTQQAFKLTNDLFSKMSPQAFMGMKFGFSEFKKIGEHEGVALHGIEMQFDLSSMPPDQVKMMKAMYGDTMQMAIAAFDKKWAMAMGKDPAGQLKTVIDRSRKKEPGLAQASWIQNAFSGMDQKAGGVLAMSISKIMASSFEAVAASMGQKPSDQKSPASHSGLFMGFQSTPAQVTITTRVPADHVKEIGDTLKMLMKPSEDVPQ